MTKNAYSHIKQAVRSNLKDKMIAWRKENTIVKIDKPTDIGRARNLGYKSKKGIVVVRVRIKRGGHKRSRPNKGRKTKRLTIRKNLKMNYGWIAEQRAARKYRNLEVLNSYQISKDGVSYFYEVILIDPSRPEIKKDKNYSWTGSPENKGRVFRGLTSAAKKSRGLRNRSRNLKIRPSQRAWNRKGK
ncbi:MAG: 50S ribosomal protein L15e [archaeon]